MVSYERRNLGQSGVLSDHVSANVRMTPHDLPLFFRKWSRLVENVVSYSDLPQIMEGAGGADELTLSVTELELLAQSARKL
jgi:hypothetical protein